MEQSEKSQVTAEASEAGQDIWEQMIKYPGWHPQAFALQAVGMELHRISDPKSGAFNVPTKAHVTSKEIANGAGGAGFFHVHK